MWCIQEITQEYRDRMYSLLSLYEKDYDELYPVVCVDEKSKQLTENIRTPLPMKPGSPVKYDYEYRRNGTGNMFVAIEPKAGKRIVQVTEQRTKQDYAYFIKDLVEIHYPNAIRIQLVTDNLNIHFTSSFYETFSGSQAEALINKIDFHYTPKHASWLNMAEIEIGIMDRQCTGGRIASLDEMQSQVAPWVNKRNIEQKKIKWTFSKQDADKKLSKHYVP